MIWTDGMQADLVSLARSGATAERAAERLGVSRSAILGRARRTGVRFLNKPWATHPPKPPKEPSRIGRPRGRYNYPREQILTALALYYSGYTALQAASVIGSPESNIYQTWSKDAALVTEARRIAQRVRQALAA